MPVPTTSPAIATANQRYYLYRPQQYAAATIKRPTKRGPAMQTEHKGLHLKERFTQTVLSRFGIDASQIATPNGPLPADAADSVLYLSLAQTKPGRRIDQPMLAFLLALQAPGRSYGDLDDDPIQLAHTIAEHCAGGGKAIAIVSDGTLSTDELCAGRAALVQSGMLQEVTYLPQGCFADAMIGGAALLLSQHNGKVTFSSTSGAHELKDRAKEIATSELLGAANETVRLDYSFICALPSLPQSGCPLQQACSISVGHNASRGTRPVWSSSPAGVRFVGPGDFINGRITQPEGLYLDAADEAPKSARLTPGVILIPRNGSDTKAFVYQGVDENNGQVIALSTFIILKPRAGVDPYYIAAFLNSDSGLKIARTGGRTRHLSAASIKRLLLPPTWEKEQATIGPAYKRAQEQLREALVSIATLEDRAACYGTSTTELS